MVRVLQVVTYMGRGGLETMLMNYYRHIDRSQLQFDFLVHRNFRSDYDDEIEALGGKIYRLPRLVPWSRTYWSALDQFFKAHPEYKVVHVHQDCLSAVILKAAKQNGVPVRIAHSHNSNQDKDLKYPIKLYYKRFIPKYATKLFACSEEAGNWMFSGAQFDVLNNAIDARKYTFDTAKREKVRKEWGIDSSAFVVGHVGRFMPQKNHGQLIQIFEALHQRDENTRLLLVGDGELRAQTEQAVSNSGLQDSVIFTGVREDVADLLQAMDVFVLPSFYEGFGIVALEAQAAGLPCVLSDQVPKGCAVTGKVDYMALSESPSAWADKICSYRGAERQDTYQMIVDAGYDIEDNAQRLQKYYIEQGTVEKA
ncbi:MAG: glycosyltransferase family 1 protein [Clostridiales bacterium]|nr:glycosyltransferase family 1 protein [Clostridiales bacterium]